MKIYSLLWIAIATAFCLHAVAHPSSGIVVNDRGEVFFVHTGNGVAKIERDGKLTYIHRNKGGHWMCLDPQGSLARTQPNPFERITPDGVRPAIIFADGGAPIAVCRDGNLYYASNWNGDDAMHPPGGRPHRFIPLSRWPTPASLPGPSGHSQANGRRSDGTCRRTRRSSLRRFAQEHL